MPGLKKTVKSLLERYYQVGATYREVSDMKFFMRRMQLEQSILSSGSVGVSSEKYCDTEIVVSLTTYGRRLYDVCYTIESLMQQTSPPNRIVLWLDPHSMVDNLPVALQKQMNRGLEVLATPDIRSYTKLVPALKMFPEAAVITVDDDMVYDFDIIERLITAHRTDPSAIQACRVHSMTFDGKGELLPYSQWDWTTASTVKRHFLTGVGGVLYPPLSLGKEVLNQDVFLSICPTADDVWFTAMAKLNGTPIMKVETRSPKGEDYVSNYEVQDMGLCRINTGRFGKNDEQIQAVFSRYGIYDFIR